MLLPLNPGIRKRRGAKERPSSSTGFIVTLAYTCRAFLEPALNTIWSTQNEFDNLFKTLPADAWYIDGSSFVSRYLRHFTL